MCNQIVIISQMVVISRQFRLKIKLCVNSELIKMSETRFEFDCLFHKYSRDITNIKSCKIVILISGDYKVLHHTYRFNRPEKSKNLVSSTKYSYIVEPSNGEFYEFTDVLMDCSAILSPISRIESSTSNVFLIHILQSTCQYFLNLYRESLIIDFTKIVDKEDFFCTMIANVTPVGGVVFLFRHLLKEQQSAKIVSAHLYILCKVVKYFMFKRCKKKTSIGCESPKCALQNLEKRYLYFDYSILHHCYCSVNSGDGIKRNHEEVKMLLRTFLPESTSHTTQI